jgi:hypothetical protein
MSDVLKNPIAVRKKENGKMPFSAKAPSYDNRTSCSLALGNDYGVGHRNPVGTEKLSGKSPIPMKAQSFSPDKVFNREDNAG